MNTNGHTFHSAATLTVRGKAAYVIEPLEGFDPRSLWRKVITLDGKKVIVTEVALVAYGDPTGQRFAVIVRRL